MLKPEYFFDTRNLKIIQQYHHRDGTITGRVQWKADVYDVVFDTEGTLHATLRV